MDEPKQLFRIVIGAFKAPDRAVSATRDLLEGGIGGGQVCVIWPPALMPEAGAAGETREMAGQVVAVTQPSLFDKVWQQASGSPLAPWMTCSQSKAILDSLRGGALVLLVSAASPVELIRASQIQFNNSPSMVQAYSFMA